MENCLLLNKVTMQFGGVIAVNNIDLELPKGIIAGIIGPNGAGKTTAFNMMSGFYTPTKGNIIFEGKDITALKPYQVAAAGIARTFQNIRLFRTQTVLENVKLGCHLRRKYSWWMAPLQFSVFNKEETDIENQAVSLLERLGLLEFADNLASSLPYGAQRRLEIARALATQPSLLLLDEPAAGMNPQESHELMLFIRELRESFDLTILLIEHDMKVVTGVCEYVWVLDYGELIAQGEPMTVCKDPKVIEAYLGEDYLHNA